MKWVTREHPRTDRIACPWLIRKFIDREAEIVYVPADQVLSHAEREQAISFDAPGARYTHRDGLCSFEVLVEEYAIDDPAVSLWRRSSTEPMLLTIATPRRNHGACWRSPTGLRCSTLMTRHSSSLSCRSMTPCTPGRNNACTDEARGLALGPGQQVTWRIAAMPDSPSRTRSSQASPVGRATISTPRRLASA